MDTPSFTREQIKRFLAEHGYTGNPQGLVQFFSIDYVAASESLAYLDINADAVRKGDEVPNRPVRLTFGRITDQPFPRWELKSIEELGPGIATKALDRHKDTSKISPWPGSKRKYVAKKKSTDAIDGALYQVEEEESGHPSRRFFVKITPTQATREKVEHLIERYCELYPKEPPPAGGTITVDLDKVERSTNRG